MKKNQREARLHLGLMIFIGLLFLAALAAYFYFVPTYRSFLSVIINPIDADNANFVKSSTNIQQALSTLDLSKYENKTEGNLNYKVIVKPSDKSSIINIAVLDSDMYFAYDLVNAIANNIQSYLSQINYNANTGTRENIEKQIAENESLLKQARANLAKSKDSDGNPVTQKKAEDYKTAISNFEAELEPLAEQIEKAKNAVPAYFVKISEKNEAVLNAIREYAEQLAQYIHLYEIDPTVSQDMFEEKVPAIKNAVYVLTASNEVTESVTEYLTLYAKQSVLNQFIDAYNEEINNFQDDVVSLQQLQSDISTYEAIIISLKQKLEESKISGTSVVMVVDAAKLDNTYFTTDRIVAAATLFLAGALVGLFLCLAKDLSNTTITHESTIRETLVNVESLGWIPYERNYNNIKKHDSYASERYRILANNINLLLNGSGAKVLSVTSPDTGEGKTTTLVNLAINLAHIGKKVMVIDADFKRPMVDNVFGIQSSDYGLTDVVTGQATKEQAIVTPVSDLSNLNFMTVGKAIDNATVVFNSDPFAFLINEFKNTYDYVLIDCAQLDFMLLSKVLDVYLLSVRAGVTTYQTLRAFNDERRTLNVPLIGYIFYGRILNGKASDSFYDVYQKAKRHEHYPRAKGSKAPLSYAVSQQEAERKTQTKEEPIPEEKLKPSVEDERPISL